jgi:signal peptidase
VKTRTTRILTAILGLALVLAPVAVIASGILPYRAFVVRTGSMSPAIPSRSLVIVEVGFYKVGQVITFHKNDELVSHRLIAINADGSLTTKGDANDSADPSPVDPGDVIGGVTGSPPGVGFWVEYLRNPLTIVSFLLWILCGWYLWPRPDPDIRARPDRG